MGVKSLSCCGNQDENTISNFRVPESDIISISSDTQKYIEDKEILLSLAPKSSLQNCYDFIISSDYYSLILKGVSPYNLISKITKNLKNSELFSLITKLMEFINKYENTKNLLIIDNIKSNLELGTKKLLKDINIKNVKNETIGKSNLMKCIGDLSIISQFINYINYHGNNKSYENNFWKSVNIENEIKMNCFKASYHLVNAKKEINNNILSDNKIDMNKRGEAIKYYKEVDGFMNNIIKNYKK
jgi:Ni,Fe-hydrogenase maturation factor